MLRATIVMRFWNPDNTYNDYQYGTYPFETNEQKNKVNEISAQLMRDRDCDVYLEESESEE